MGVLVGVCVGVSVGVSVGVLVGVSVGVGVFVGVLVGVAVEPTARVVKLAYVAPGYRESGAAFMALLAIFEARK